MSSAANIHAEGIWEDFCGRKLLLFLSMARHTVELKDDDMAMKFMKDGSGANGNTISQPDFSPPPHPTSMYPPLVIPIHSNVVRFFFINYI